MSRSSLRVSSARGCETFLVRAPETQELLQVRDRCEIEVLLQAEGLGRVRRHSTTSASSMNAVAVALLRQEELAVLREVLVEASRA